MTLVLLIKIAAVVAAFAFILFNQWGRVRIALAQRRGEGRAKTGSQVLEDAP